VGPRGHEIRRLRRDMYRRVTVRGGPVISDFRTDGPRRTGVRLSGPARAFKTHLGEVQICRALTCL